MTCESIINIICAITSVVLSVVAIIISICQFKKTSKISKEIDDREVSKYKKEVDIEARKFIIKYNETGEIQLLPLCLIADLYECVHPYRREIYREWCCLSEDVKTQVLKIRNINFTEECFCEKDHFWDNSLKLLKDCLDNHFSKEIYNQLFYDNAKYLNSCFTDYKKIEEKDANYSIGKYKSLFNNENIFTIKDAVTDIIYKVDIEKTIVNINQQSYKFIGKEENLKKYFTSAQENYQASYICCLIGIHTSYLTYRNRNMKFEYNDYINDFSSYNEWYLEDIVLHALLYINIFQEKNVIGEINE